MAPLDSDSTLPTKTKAHKTTDKEIENIEIPVKMEATRTFYPRSHDGRFRGHHPIKFSIDRSKWTRGHEFIEFENDLSTRRFTGR